MESDELEGDNPEFSAFASKYVQVEVEARAVAAVVVQARHSMLGSNDSLVESSEGRLLRLKAMKLARQLAMSQGVCRLEQPVR